MTVVVVALVLLLCSSPLFAQSSYSDFERGLGLSDDQRARADQIKRRYMGEMRYLQQEALNRRLQLRELDGAAPQNRQRINRLRREIEDLEMSKGQIFHLYRSELKKTLNDQQRERYNSYCESQNRQNSRRFKQRGYGP
jgi:hypothetical protein